MRWNCFNFTIFFTDFLVKPCQFVKPQQFHEFTWILSCHKNSLNDNIYHNNSTTVVISRIFPGFQEFVRFQFLPLQFREFIENFYVLIFRPSQWSATTITRAGSSRSPTCRPSQPRWPSSNNYNNPSSSKGNNLTLKWGQVCPQDHKSLCPAPILLYPDQAG